MTEYIKPPRRIIDENGPRSVRQVCVWINTLLSSFLYFFFFLLALSLSISPSDDDDSRSRRRCQQLTQKETAPAPPSCCPPPFCGPSVWTEKRFPDSLADFPRSLSPSRLSDFHARGMHISFSPLSFAFFRTFLWRRGWLFGFLSNPFREDASHHGPFTRGRTAKYSKLLFFSLLFLS